MANPQNQAQTPGIRDLWEKFPWVTRHASLFAVILRIAAIYSPYIVIHTWNIPGKPWWQLYRVFTSALSTSRSGLGGVISLYMFSTWLNDLDGGIFRNRARILYYLTFVTVIFYLVGPRFGIYCYLDGLTAALTWTLGQEEPFGVITLVFLPVARRYVPLANLVIVLLSGGGVNGMIESLIGYLAAHLFMYITELVPAAGGPKWLKRIPYVFRIPDILEEVERKREQQWSIFGSGQKLGKNKKWGW